jgi:histidyl-tRNA synthetase
VPFEINPRLVRGLDYYNLTVFEWVSDGLAVCAGGRYDGLFEQIGGRPTPACGFAIGIERLLALLRQESRETAPDVYLVNQGEDAVQFAFRAAESLRDAGFSVVQHCGGGSFKSQMKKADASGARVAVIIGDEEARDGQASIKPLREAREQLRVSVDAMAKAVADLMPMSQEEDE